MNALLEPWEEEALSDDISWGVMPALRQQTDVLPDTAGSGAAAADGSGAAGADGASMGDGAAAAGDAGDTAAAGGDGGSNAAAVSGLAALAPGQELDLGVMYRGPKVRCCSYLLSMYAADYVTVAISRRWMYVACEQLLRTNSGQYGAFGSAQLTPDSKMCVLCSLRWFAVVRRPCPGSAGFAVRYSTAPATAP